MKELLWSTVRLEEAETSDLGTLICHHRTSESQDLARLRIHELWPLPFLLFAVWTLELVLAVVGNPPPVEQILADAGSWMHLVGLVVQEEHLAVETKLEVEP